MNYRKSASSRRLKAKILWIYEIIRFKFSILTIPNFLIVIWGFIVLFGLFLPWIKSMWITETFSENAFSYRIGHIGYIIFLLSMISILFPLFSFRKDKIKERFSISFRDHNLMFLSSVLIIMLNFVTLSFIKGLSTYSNTITYWNWIIYSLIWWIFILLWWIWLYRDFRRELKSLYIENNSDFYSDYSDDHKNMKLPF